MTRLSLRVLLRGSEEQVLLEEQDEIAVLEKLETAEQELQHQLQDHQLREVAVVVQQEKILVQHLLELEALVEVEQVE